MFEDPKLFRQARTMLEISRREVAEAVGVKGSSVVDAETGKKTFRLELSFRLWAGLWEVVQKKKQNFTKEQIERNEPLLDMMLCAYGGLAADISPEKLLKWFRGEGEITAEEKQRWTSWFKSRWPESSAKNEAAKATEEKVYGSLAPVMPRLTFDQAGRMSWLEVEAFVEKEITSSQFNLLQSLGGQSPSQTQEALMAEVDADPRVQFAKLKEEHGSALKWIKRIEKERDHLKLQLREAELKASNERLNDIEELLEAYRRIDALEKELAEKRQN